MTINVWNLHDTNKHLLSLLVHQMANDKIVPYYRLPVYYDLMQTSCVLSLLTRMKQCGN
jgi:hypothetical protein